MAGTITHLVIADRLLLKLPDRIKDRIKNLSLYYCGNLAPDAIMARENYVREMKKHTHFKDGIPEDELAKKENFELYRSRFEAFARHFLIEQIEDFDLLIASTAIANNSILVSENLKHMGRIQGIRLENWVER